MAETTEEEQLDAIAESVADGVKLVEVDGQKVEQLSLRDRIEAAKFLAAQKRRGKPAVRMTRIIPPGAA